MLGHGKARHGSHERVGEAASVRYDLPQALGARHRYEITRHSAHPVTPNTVLWLFGVRWLQGRCEAAQMTMHCLGWSE